MADDLLTSMAKQGLAVPTKEELERFARDFEAYRLAVDKALIDGKPPPSPPEFPVGKVQTAVSVPDNKGKPVSDLLKKISQQATVAVQNAPAIPQLGAAFATGGKPEERRPGQPVSDIFRSNETTDFKPAVPTGPGPVGPAFSPENQSGERRPGQPISDIFRSDATTDYQPPQAQPSQTPEDQWEQAQAVLKRFQQQTTAGIPPLTPAPALPNLPQGFAWKGPAPDVPKMYDPEQAKPPAPATGGIPAFLPGVSPPTPVVPPQDPFNGGIPAFPFSMPAQATGQPALPRIPQPGMPAWPPVLPGNPPSSPTGPPPLPASFGMSLEKGLDPIRGLIEKITEQMNFDQPKYANANAPLTANLQSNLGSLPFVGQLTGAFAPLIRFSEALSQSYAIQKQNMDRYNIALVEHEKKLKAEFKAQGMSDTDAGDLAKRQTKMIKDQGIGLPGAPAPSAAGAAGAGGTGAMSTALATAGALGMVASTAMAASQAFQAVVSTARRYVEALSPATVFALDRAQRDLTATIGVALLPIVSVATGVLREFASVLLPITQRIQPIVQRIAEMTSGMLSKAFDWFGKTADALMPLVEAGLSLVEAFAPLVDASIAISGVMLDMLKPVIVIVSAAIQAIAIPIKMMADGIAAFTPLFTAFGAVISGLAEMMKSVFSSIAGALGLGDITDAGKQLKGVFEAIAIAGLKAVAMFAKWMGGDAFIAGMIKSLAPAVRESAVGMAVIQNPAVTSLQEWSRKVATQSLLAGPGGDAQKKTTEGWLEDAVKSLKEIQTGQGGTIKDAISDWWTGNKQEFFTGVGEAVRAILPSGTYSAVGAMQGMAVAIGNPFGAAMKLVSGSTKE